MPTCAGHCMPWAKPRHHRTHRGGWADCGPGTTGWPWCWACRWPGWLQPVWPARAYSPGSPCLCGGSPRRCLRSLRHSRQRRLHSSRPYRPALPLCCLPMPPWPRHRCGPPPPDLPPLTRWWPPPKTANPSSSARWAMWCWAATIPSTACPRPLTGSASPRCGASCARPMWWWATWRACCPTPARRAKMPASPACTPSACPPATRSRCATWGLT